VFDQIADAEDLDKIASSGQGDQNLMQEIIEEEEICAEQAQLDEQRTGNLTTKRTQLQRWAPRSCRGTLKTKSQAKINLKRRFKYWTRKGKFCAK